MLENIRFNQLNCTACKEQIQKHDYDFCMTPKSIESAPRQAQPGLAHPNLAWTCSEMSSSMNKFINSMKITPFRTTSAALSLLRLGHLHQNMEATPGRLCHRSGRVGEDTPRDARGKSTLRGLSLCRRPENPRCESMTEYSTCTTQTTW